jgi:DNA-binding CsgD family transcriptional regulator
MTSNSTVGDHSESLQRISRLHSQLSARQKEVLDLLVAGHSLKEIAVRLHISVQAAWKHRQHIFMKFDVVNEVQLVRILLPDEVSHINFSEQRI